MKIECGRLAFNDWRATSLMPWIAIGLTCRFSLNLSQKCLIALLTNMTLGVFCLALASKTSMFLYRTFAYYFKKILKAENLLTTFLWRLGSPNLTVSWPIIATCKFLTTQSIKNITPHGCRMSV